VTDLKNLWDFLDDDGFDAGPVPSRDFPEGKKYHVSSPDGETGARLSALVVIAAKSRQKLDVSAADMARLNLDDEQERDLMQQTLGDAYEEMMSDGVKWQALSRLGQYALVFHTQGETAANEAAEAGIFSGKAPARNRAQTRAAAKTPGKAPSTSRASTATKKPRTAAAAKRPSPTS